MGSPKLRAGTCCFGFASPGREGDSYGLAPGAGDSPRGAVGTYAAAEAVYDRDGVSDTHYVIKSRDSFIMFSMMAGGHEMDAQVCHRCPETPFRWRFPHARQDMELRFTAAPNWATTDSLR